MKSNSLWMGFEIQTVNGPILQPNKISLWQDNQYKNTKPEAPFYYRADALVGLSMLHLCQHSKNPFKQKVNTLFAQEAWCALEPHHELYIRASHRAKSIHYAPQTQKKVALDSFCRSFTEVIDTSVSQQGVDLAELTSLIKEIEHLENKLHTPLLYNFELHFSKEMESHLLYLHSLLFNLRALIAMDFNAYIQDATFEAVKLDSISDYLAKPDYVSNDAILYFHFKKFADKLPSQLTRAFAEYSHNAYFLIENLPKSYLHSVAAKDLEDTLYLLQIDWLLGTHAGLLFRIREELYGVLEGYEKIFWPELEGKPHQPSHSLSVNCQITEKDLYPRSAAA